MASAPLSGANRQIRVLIVDDSLVARTLLTRMLDERDGFTVVGQAAKAGMFDAHYTVLDRWKCNAPGSP